MVTLTIPWPPSVNHYWRHVGNKPLISAKGRDYRNQIAGCVLSAGANVGLAGRLAVEIKAYPPDRRRRDLDNLFKAVLDALDYAGVYEDDSQIDELSIVREGVAKKGWLVVRIREVSDE